MSPSLRTWLQLFRAPNLFTVPGDPLAGFLLATFGVLTSEVIFGIVASLCLYAGGLLLNDLRDLEEDRRERPTRPLPSGAAETRHVWAVMSLLLFAGVAALAIGAGWRGLLVGLALLMAIVAYNCVTKHIPIVGPLNMGLCRGLNVYAGGVTAYSTVFPQTTGLLVIVGITVLYFAAVTNLARYETREIAPWLARLLPALAALCGVGLLSWGTWSTGPFFASPMTACFACGFLLVVKETVPLFREPRSPLAPRIGALIRLWLIFQAAFCMAVSISEPPWICATALLILFPVSGAVSRRFYGS